jgi:predicted aspartyl protease
MYEINAELGYVRIPFVFDTGATYTMLNKQFADARGWEIFKRNVPFGGYVKGGKTTMCDLRKIPLLYFGSRQIRDFVVATPADEAEEVNNLLGRSFIDNFHFAVNQDEGKIYFNERNIDANPEYSYSRILQEV